MSKDRLKTATTFMSAVSLSMTLGREVKSRYDGWTLHSASIKSNSYVYPTLLEWLNQETKTKRVRFSSDVSGIRRFYDNASTATIELNGHKIKVAIEKPESIKIIDEETIMTDTLVFTAHSQAGIDEVHNLLEALTLKRKRTARSVNVYNLASYGGWEPRAFPYRDIDSVFLARGVKEDLLADLDSFFESEIQYGRIGIPWHRGYLFYGPPGNGKSSLASSIAHHYRMNLYNMPLSGVKDDKALSDAVARISDNSILLLEDIDIFSRSMGREQADKGPTLAGLLNALDGVSTPHGLLTFMTTNHVDSLDPALIRPGRIDKKIELTPPTQHQVESMFEYVYDVPLGTSARQFSSMAELANVFKKSLTDIGYARSEIKDKANGLSYVS